MSYLPRLGMGLIFNGPCFTIISYVVIKNYTIIIRKYPMFIIVRHFHAGHFLFMINSIKGGLNKNIHGNFLEML